jgi:hypothetical protein
MSVETLRHIAEFSDAMNLAAEKLFLLKDAFPVCRKSVIEDVAAVRELRIDILTYLMDHQSQVEETEGMKLRQTRRAREKRESEADARRIAKTQAALAREAAAQKKKKKARAPGTPQLVPRSVPA